MSSSEELVLNTVATVNNLSFYNTKTSAINTLQVRVLEGMEGGATDKAVTAVSFPCYLPVHYKVKNRLNYIAKMCALHL